MLLVGVNLTGVTDLSCCVVLIVVKPDCIGLSLFTRKQYAVGFVAIESSLMTLIRGTRRLSYLVAKKVSSMSNKVTMLKFTQIVLVPETNLQRVSFASASEASDLVQRLREHGFKLELAATFAYCSDLVAAGIFSAEQVEKYKEDCRKSRQGVLDNLKSKASESAHAQLMYETYKAMYANGTDTIPKFGKDAVFVNDGNQRTNLMFDAEILRQEAFQAEAKNLGTKYEPEYTKTIPANERKFANMMEWYMGQATSNAISETRVNLKIMDRIKSATQALMLGATFGTVCGLMPAGSSRQRAPFAAYVNKITGGLLLERMQLKSTDDNYIAEGNIFASGLKDKMTLDDRIQIVVSKFDSVRRKEFAENNKDEWAKAEKGESSKAVPASIVAIANGTKPVWKIDDIKNWLDSITKKGMESRTSTVESSTAATEAVKSLKDNATSLAEMSGCDLVADLVKGAVGDDAKRKEFSDKVAEIGPVLTVVSELFNADKAGTIALADVLRGIDVTKLPAIVEAVKSVLTVKAAPQGGKRPVKHAKGK